MKNSRRAPNKDKVKTEKGRKSKRCRKRRLGCIPHATYNFFCHYPFTHMYMRRCLCCCVVPHIAYDTSQAAAARGFRRPEISKQVDTTTETTTRLTRTSRPKMALIQPGPAAPGAPDAPLPRIGSRTFRIAEGEAKVSQSYVRQPPAETLFEHGAVWCRVVCEESKHEY